MTEINSIISSYFENLDALSLQMNSPSINSKIIHACELEKNIINLYYDDGSVLQIDRKGKVLKSINSIKAAKIKKQYIKPNKPFTRFDKQIRRR